MTQKDMLLTYKQQHFLFFQYSEGHFYNCVFILNLSIMLSHFSYKVVKWKKKRSVLVGKIVYLGDYFAA